MYGGPPTQEPSWQPFADTAAHLTNGTAPTERQLKALNAEYETDIHFQKCYGVMAELFEAHGYLHNNIPETGFKFLDLGCAPGGFSTYMLEDRRCKAGFGVTLPSTSGGFPMRLRSNNFFLQQGDLFEIGPTDLLASDVNVCICDAQYLRNNVAWDEKYRGVRCRSKQHGVWALLIKQFWLGMSKLSQGGVLIFRFGWRDPGPEDIATIWYKKCTLRLFTILYDLFENVREVKSDYFNALQSSFYVCCTNFNRTKFDGREIAKLFGQQFNNLLTTRIQDSNELEILPQVDKIRTQKVDQVISDMLDRVDKLRLINQNSRKWHSKEEAKWQDPRAVVFVSPVPQGMGTQELESFFAVYGIVQRVDVNGNEEASIQFVKVEHAQTAVLALRSSASFTAAFGDTGKVWIREEEKMDRSNDSWAQEWSMSPSAAANATGMYTSSYEKQPWTEATGSDFQGQVPPGYRYPVGKSNGKGKSNGYGGKMNNGSMGRGSGMQNSRQQPKGQNGLGASQTVGKQPPPPPPSAPEEQACHTDSSQVQSEAESTDKPGLHPALQDHQAKTKDLIAQLLKPKQ